MTWDAIEAFLKRRQEMVRRQLERVEEESNIRKLQGQAELLYELLDLPALLEQEKRDHRGKELHPGRN